MSGEKTKRRYELRKRAEGVADTRRRIAQAAVELHGSIGPARTTMTAVAERAGVQRHTLYRHFPSEADLLLACSTHWAASHPQPDPAAWSAIDDPSERLHRGLTDLYEYFEAGEDMLGNILRDAATLDVLRPYEEDLTAYFEAAAAVLARGRPARGAQRRLVCVALRHAVDFATWRSLTREAGGTTQQALELMVRLVEAAGRGASAEVRAGG